MPEATASTAAGPGSDDPDNEPPLVPLVESAVEAPVEAPLVSLREALPVWTAVALQSFGGPAGQIAVMHRILVEERRWISEERFLHALSYCMLLPGPEAQQLATYVGWLLHKTPGALLAGILFVLPGLLAMLALSFVYVLYGDVGFVAGLFYGLKPAVFAIVVEAVGRIGRRALRHRLLYAVAALAFVAIFFLRVPFPWIVAGGALAGLLLHRFRPDAMLRGGGAAGHGGAGAGSGAASASGSDAAAAAPPPTIAALLDAHSPRHTRPSLRRALRVLAVCGTLWLLPLLLLRVVAGAGSVFVQIGEFFSRAAVVTFGGAYAVLAYVAQQAVEVYGWLEPGEMLDGLGLAETTPGPLIMVVQFVGFLGAFRHPGDLDPLLAATFGALLTTWVTFVPCFLWILLGAPWIEGLRSNRALSAALTGITAAVVGVILNLAVWFGLHTLFAEVGEAHVAGLRWLLPAAGSLDPPALVLAAAALLATLRYKLGLLAVLGGSAALGAAWTLLRST